MHVRNLVASGNLLPIWKELARAIVISTLDFFPSSIFILPPFLSFPPPPPPPPPLLPISSCNSLPHNLFLPTNLSLPCLHIPLENLPFLPSYNPPCSSLSLTFPSPSLPPPGLCHQVFRNQPSVFRLKRQLRAPPDSGVCS